jgi:hypothetical protein
MDDSDAIVDFITTRITEVLDLLCPVGAIRVRKGKCLYLSKETRALMKDRDKASGDNYKVLRNLVCSLVKRDRIMSHLSKLWEHLEDQRLIWQLANNSLGMGGPPSLPQSIIAPSGLKTSGAAAAADVMNAYYIDKVNLLREKIPSAHIHPQISASKEKTFAFSYANAGRVSATIKALGNSQAVGIDGIPMLVFKLGSEVLSSPIARLVNVSLSSGIIPRSFKTALVIPVHKGKGKAHADPSSYRPVSLLPAMSKILEAIVKSDLEGHFKTVNALPDSQHGFRPARSTTTALAVNHASWLEARKAVGVVGIMAFDLSAAFDTVSKQQLLPKLEGLGVRGRALEWFDNYLTGGRQAVVWDSATSNFIPIDYGVRQGSLLGPLLFLALVHDMPLHVGEDNISCYADDSCVWSSAKDVGTLKLALEERASKFATYVASCGLVMNSSKTQVLISSKKLPPDFSVTVCGSNITPAAELELLGVTFDRDLSLRPQHRSLATAARQRSSKIARLSLHLPRGAYLRQLSHGLLYGKVGYATPILVRPRLDVDSAPHSADLKSVQVAINDTARSITGHKRDDHTKIPDLLAKAKILSLNKVSIKSTALSCWSAFHSCDGGSGERNALGKAIFGRRLNNTNCNTRTRSNTSGEVTIPLRGEDTFVSFAARLWNRSPALREAASKGMVLAAANELGELSEVSVKLPDDR